MRGTPFIYQGQEIGMTNTQFASLQDFDDVRAKNLFRERRAADWSDEQILAELGPTSRDNARTPMQWDSSPQAGFTSGKPWLKVNPNYLSINVETEEKNPRSVLNFYRALARLRASDEVFVYGEYDLILADHPQVFAYVRTLGDRKVAVVCNLSDREVAVGIEGEVLLGNYEGSAQKFWPFETRVLRLSSETGLS